MRKYSLLYGLLAAALLSGFLLSTSVYRQPQEHTVDLIAVNDMVKTAQQHWGSLEALNDQPFVYRASIVDHQGNVVWATDRETAQTLPEAIRQGYAILDISVDGQTVGKALIETRPDALMEQARQNLARLTMLFTGLLAILLGFFWLGIHRRMIKPFRKLEAFAHKISTGRFDQPLPMEQNNLFGAFTESFDVMRTSLLEAQQKQAAAEGAKKELIASLSHDIKTPATSIQLITELLLAGNPEPAMGEKLKTIEAKVDQINRLMNDMMHSTLEELGELKVNLTSESSGLLQQLLEGADDSGRVRLGSIPSCMVDLDVLRMEQVIGNIIANACKYADTRIDVTSEIREEYLCMDIRDYGPGVSPEEIERVCTKFYRGEAAREAGKNGEGLGLYIAKLLMEKMGGGLEVLHQADGFGVRLMLKLSQ